MQSQKYAHLKLQRLENEFRYVLFASQEDFNKAVSFLSSNDLDYFSFSFKGERSLILSAKEVVFTATKEQDGWVGFSIIGEMPFGTVQGLISTISSCLFQEDVGVCVVSTFKTDLFLVKKEKADSAIELLKSHGWAILG